MSAYTSALSVDEFLLVREAGYAPAGLVVGASVARLARRRRVRRPRLDHDLSDWCQPLLKAKLLAVSRLRDEAAVSGAVGVIGVEVAVVRKRRVYEVVATGTALTGDAGAGGTFTCGLRGQEFWALLQSGRRPLGLVMGASAFYRTYYPSGPLTWSPPLNDEHPWRTEGVYLARAQAMGQMTDASGHLGASATVGVVVTESTDSNDRASATVSEFVVSGTAVQAAQAPQPVPRPQRMLPLS